MSTKRIAGNVFATWVQNFLSIIIGFFTIRWVLSALGETQYGVFCVVGSVISFVGIFNGLMTTSCTRFFAYAIGKAKTNSYTNEKNELREWFNCAFFIHLIMAFILCLTLYPIGIYIINNTLNIPNNFLSSSIIIFRISIIAMFFSILNIPFHAIYTAKQLIFVRNISYVIQSLLLGLAAWFILKYSGDKLIMHSILTASIMSIISITMSLLAIYSFTDCRIVLKELVNTKKIKEMFSYTLYSMFGIVAATLFNPLINIIMNSFVGISINALLNLSIHLSTKINTIAEAFSSAISPEITTRLGSNNVEHSKSLAISSCFISSAVLGGVLTSLWIWCTDVIDLWLDKPPQGLPLIIFIFTLKSLILYSTNGYMILIHASGKIKKYQKILCLIILFSLILLIVLLKLEINHFLSLGIILIFSHVLTSALRIIIVKKMFKIKLSIFLYQLLIPITSLILLLLSICALLNSIDIFKSITGFLISLITNFSIVIVSIILWYKKFRSENIIYKLKCILKK